MVRRIALLTFFLVAPSLAWAQTPPKTPTIKRETAKMTPGNDGAEMYRSYCAACHGRTGKGDGPAAAALKTRPTDLTKLKTGEEFPVKDFDDKVTGNMSPSHGSQDMPVWGPIFRQMGNDTLRLYNLRKYVESLQGSH